MVDAQRQGQAGGFQSVVSQVVVPVEGSSQELVVQDWAAQFAGSIGVPLRAVHISTDARKVPGDIFRYVQDLCKRRKIPFSSKILNGSNVAQELVEELEGTDIVVIGTRLLGTEYHMGSVAEALVRAAPCPVQVMRL
jgi:nucleotide-binding universal stress UspA family protein